MPNTNVLRLDDYRERRDQRVKLATSLYLVDPGRAELMEHLSRLANLLGADRVGTVWVDEYGPGLAHPYVVADLLNDRPRRLFPVEPLRRAWEKGVPGVLESVSWARSEGAPWTLAVALGSDGTRSWFLVADAVSPRPAVDADLRNRVMFIAGECSAIVLHRDLDPMTGTSRRKDAESRPRFAGWPILKDVEGREDDEELSRRIALRFIVARLPRLLVDDDLTLSPERLRQQADRAREEIRAKERDGARHPESVLWDAVLDAYEQGDLEGLGAALLDLGLAADADSHLNGAVELYALAYEVFAATTQAHAAVEAARFAGRAERRLARWDEAHRWYGVARGVAEAACLEHKVAVILDGVANIHRDRGNHPAARETLQEAQSFALRSGDGRAIASIEHGLLALEHVAGNLEAAVAHGWRAVRTYPGRTDQVRALASLAGALIDAGELRAAEDAWSIVARLSDEDYYRLFALEALAYVAALRGDHALFTARAAASDKAGWEAGPLTVRADILLHRGLGLKALGEVGMAARWLRRAVEFAGEHRFGRCVFEAEEALRSPLPEKNEREAPVKVPPATLEVRQGLQQMRAEVAAV